MYQPPLLDYPALNGEVVTEGHATICRERGHASHKIDGVEQVHCPRCGADTRIPATTVDHMGEHVVTMLPSGEYAAYTPTPTRWDTDGRPSVQVAQNIRGIWFPTPGRWLAETVEHYAEQDTRLAIDYGQHWSLSPADTRALGEFARGLLEPVAADDTLGDE